MFRREYYTNPKYLSDLNDFNSAENELAIIANAKNIDKLKDLSITKLWLIGGKDKELEKIFSFVTPQFINVYQVLAKDLTILESLTNTETIVLRWNTKSDKLWNMSHNTGLKTLVIEDFPKITSIEAIASANYLEYLVLEGGMWNPLKLDTLKPLSELQMLKFLRLVNMHVREDGLRPIAVLKDLKELMLSNQFETIDYAYLSAKLPGTQCEYFKPYVKYDKPIGDRDIMIIGKRKPFLNSLNDRTKIEKYERDFYKMVSDFSSQ